MYSSENFKIEPQRPEKIKKQQSSPEGTPVGAVGFFVVGFAVGLLEGDFVGASVGIAEGATVVGFAVGIAVEGFRVGVGVGATRIKRRTLVTGGN